MNNLIRIEDVSCVVDADGLFPAVVWTVIHANLSNINARIGHIHRAIEDGNRQFGEGAFCLALIEGPNNQ